MSSMCGKWAWRNKNTGSVKAWYCGSARCRRKRCKTAYHAKRLDQVIYGCESRKLNRFLTLTVKPSSIPKGTCPWKHISTTWNKFRTIISRKYPEFEYLGILEQHKDGRPHIHAFINMYLPIDEVIQHWTNCGGGRSLKIELVKSSRQAQEYVTKSLDVYKYVGKQQLTDAANSVPKRSRTLWRSKLVKDRPKPESKKEVELMKEVMYNEDGELTEEARKLLLYLDRRTQDEEQQREVMEGALQAISTEGTEASVSQLETTETKIIREQENKSIASTETQGKLRDKKTQRQVTFEFIQEVYEHPNQYMEEQHYVTFKKKYPKQLANRQGDIPDYTIQGED